MKVGRRRERESDRKIEREKLRKRERERQSERTFSKTDKKLKIVSGEVCSKKKSEERERE